MNPKVTAFLKKATAWRAEMEALRSIVLDCGLIEELKWGKPCYRSGNSNIAIVIPFKESCALMFCQGALLRDRDHLLSKPGENTQAGRWVKFTSVQEIAKLAPKLKTYLREAIAADNAGLKVPHKKTSDYKMPEELKTKFAQSPELKTAFAALTPGRQRGYLLHFSGAKQSATRTARIDRCVQRILDGKGLLD